MVADSGFLVYDSRFLVFDSRVLVSDSFGFRLTGFSFRLTGFGFRFTGFCFRLTGFSFRLIVWPVQIQFHEGQEKANSFLGLHWKMNPVNRNAAFRGTATTWPWQVFARSPQTLLTPLPMLVGCQLLGAVSHFCVAFKVIYINILKVSWSVLAS